MKSQVEQFEKVILTRYFKPQVTYSLMTSPEFDQAGIKQDFISFLNDIPESNDDFRNFISFKQSKQFPELPYKEFADVPRNPLIPDKSFISMIKTFFKASLYPILNYQSKKAKQRIEYSVNNQLKETAQKIAKERIKNLWGFDKFGHFDYQTLLKEAKKNSNDLEDFVSDNSIMKSLAYKDLMVELRIYCSGVSSCILSLFII